MLCLLLRFALLQLFATLQLLPFATLQLLLLLQIFTSKSKERCPGACICAWFVVFCFVLHCCSCLPLLQRLPLLPFATFATFATFAIVANLYFQI